MPQRNVVVHEYECLDIEGVWITAVEPADARRERLSCGRAEAGDGPASSMRGGIASISIFAARRIVASMSHRSELPPEHLVAELVGLLDDAREIDDPADLELLAGTLLLPISIPEVPEAARRVVIDAIEARADPIASAALAALAVFAPSPLAAHTREAAARLAGRGVTHSFVADIGTLSVDSAAAGADDDTEMIVAVLARPHSRDRQVLVVGIDVTTDAMIECMLTPPLPRRDADRLLRNPTNDASAPPLAPLTTAELAARVIATAGRARDLGIALGSDAAPVLPIIARALTGAADAVAWPETLAPWEEDDDELSIFDGALDPAELIERLCLEFEEHIREQWPSASAVRRHAGAVGGEMLRWRAATLDGHLGRWEVDDLATFLIEHVSSGSGLDDDARTAAPDCALAMIRFLADRGSLSGDPLPDLERACEMLRAHAAGNRPRGDATGRRRAKRKAQRSARKQSRRR